jgi:ribosomal protein L3 glutamine methyltransferase
MKASRRGSDALFAGTERLRTLGEWLAWTEAAYQHHRLALGQVADNAHDEALYLLLRVANLPLESGPGVLRQPLAPAVVQRVKHALAKRIQERIPAAYLTREAWLGGHRFYVDERVIIPRSYFVELLPELARRLGGAERVRQAVDVCTGSGCLAILMAHAFGAARVDAIDLSPDALAVADINVREHRLLERITLHRSDVFDEVRPRPYDLILSNPPYEPSAICDDLPPEFQHEPRLALDGGADGLDIIRKLLKQARERLAPHGLVAIEVGGLQESMERAFPRLDIEWMETADGSNCVGVIRAQRLLA